ncbi:cation:proton antiporter, partial [[Eubacterium] siraeum]|nr:cation:proton antiporter [[Eubacterium] siraeum]
GLMSSGLFGPRVIMVVISTVVTPILLKFVFTDKNDASGVRMSKEAAEVTTSDDSLEYVPGQDNV